MLGRRPLINRVLAAVAFAALGAAAYQAAAASATTGLTVQHVAPGAIGTGASRPATIKGTGFTTGTTATVSGSGVTVSNIVHVNSTTMTATISAAFSASLGAHTLFVHKGADSDFLSGAIQVSAHPSLTTVTPSHVAGTGVRQVVTVHGTGFATGATASVDGGDITTGTVTVVSSTTAKVPLYVAPSAATGLRKVTITNLDQGMTAAPPLLVVDPLPTISTVSVATLNQGETTTATIAGANFRSGAKAFLGAGVTATTLSQSPTSLTVRFVASQTALFGLRTLTVLNTDTGAAKLVNAVKVDYVPVFTKWAVGQGATSWVTTLQRPTFTSAPSLSFTGTGITLGSVTVNPSHQVVVSFSISPSAAATWRNMTITQGSTTWHIPRGLKVRVAPTVTSVTSLPQGATTQTIAVKGSHFEVCGATEPTVTISGTGVTINSVNAVYGFLIYLNVDVSPSAPLGARDVTITNCDSGGTKTSTGVFTITT